MKSIRQNRFLASIRAGISLAGCLFVTTSFALGGLVSTAYWDTNDITAGSGNLGGNWDSAFWSPNPDGTAETTNWNNGDMAVFSAGTDGTGNWTVTLGSTVTASGITFAQTGTKTLTGDTIIIGGGVIDSSALGFAPGNGDDININSILAGSGGLTIKAHGDAASNNGGGGGAEFRLGGVNTFSGGLTITSGLVSWADDANLGDAANIVTLNGGGLLYTGANLTSPRSVQIGSQGGTIRLYGSSNLTLTAPISNGTGVVSTTLRRTDGGNLYLTAPVSGFTGNFINGAGATWLAVANADWSNTDFTVDGGNLVAGGTGTAVVNSINSTADVIIDNGTTLNVDTGAITMRTGHYYKTNNGALGKLTSSSGTLTITNGVLPSGELTTTDHQIRVKITDSGATPVKLVKNNQNLLILSEANTHSGGTTINGGRIQADNVKSFGTGAVTVNDGGQAYLRLAGATYTNDFTLNGAGVFEGANAYGALRLEQNPKVTGTITVASASRITALSANDNGTLSGALIGSAALEKTGAGTINLTGDSPAYTGQLTVAAGRLKLAGSLAGSVVANDATTLSGEGTIGGGLTLGSGVKLALNVDGASAGALTANGGLTVNGSADVNLTNFPAVAGSPVTVLNYSGTLTIPTTLANAFVLVGASTYRGTPVFADTGSAITLTIPDGRSLTWVGGDTLQPTFWDINTTPNWKSGTADPDVFFNGDSVTFDDSGAKTVEMKGLLSPSLVTFNNSAGNDYTINPNGVGFGFTGGTSIVKNGAGTATILGYSHNYTGTVTINQGVLQPNGNYEILGNTSGVFINEGGQLNINGTNLGNGTRHYNFTIAGNGPDGLGAVTNSGAGGPAANAGILNLTLTADASAGGNGGRFDMGRSGSLGGTIAGNGHTLTKVGSNTVTMRGPATNITYAVAAGTLKFEDSDTATGSNPIAINAGTLQSYGNRVFANPLNFAAGTTLDNDGGGAQVWSGPIKLTGTTADTVTISPRGGALTLSNVITGDSNILITNNNTLYLTGAASNTYTGSTTVNGISQIVLQKSGGAVAIPGDLTLQTDGTRNIVSTAFDQQFAPGSVLHFGGAGDSRLELKGTTQTLGGLDYPTAMVGYKAIQHSEFGIPAAVDAVSDLVLNVANGKSFTYTGVIRSQGGTVSLTKTGLGTQKLTGSLIDYTGPTVVTAGRMILDSDDFHSASLAISNNAVWEMNVTSLTKTLQSDATGFTITGAGTYQKTGGGVASLGWSGGASIAMSSGGLIDIVEGTVRMEYGGLTTWTNNKGDLNIATGATFDLWDNFNDINVDSLNGGGSITRTTSAADGSLVVGVDNGSGDFSGGISNTVGKTSLVKTGTGTQKLSGYSTYSGDTTVNGGTLELTEPGTLRFALASGSSNQINGTGTVKLDGWFNIDTSVLASISGTWTLVRTDTLTVTYGSTFSPGASWVEATPGNWTYDDGNGATGTFTETTGVLTLSNGADYASWIDGYFPGETDPLIIGASADPDHDGVSNAAELVLGGDPKSGMDAALLPTIELVTDPVGAPAGDYLLFTYRRTDLSVDSGVIASAQYDTDLAGTWTTAQSGVNNVVVVEDNDYASFDPAATAPTDRVRVFVPRAANQKLFGRLNILVP